MGLSAEAMRAQVERLAHSKPFESSEVHRNLLRYLAEKAIAGESDRLKEYIVGLEAFGKPPSYDPKFDSIVRLQVGRLRQKIAAYYAEEGPDDPVRVVLPKGGFKLQFEEAAPQRGPGVREPWWALRRVVVALGALLAVTIVWASVASLQLARLRREAPAVEGRWSPELEAVWSPFLESKRQLVLCLGTPLFIRFPDLGFFRDPKTNDWQDAAASERVSSLRKAFPNSEMMPWYAFTGAGEANAAVLVSNLLSTRKREISLTRSNILSWQELKDNDVIFIGPPKFNLQLQSAAPVQDIVLDAEGIRNLRPQPGEPVLLQDRMVPGKQSEGETHALISLLPGLSGKGYLLIMGGNASADTFAAGEWLTSPGRAAELLQHLRSKSGELPKYFEVVLKVAFKQGIPVESSYVFHHVLNVSPHPGTRNP